MSFPDCTWKQKQSGQIFMKLEEKCSKYKINWSVKPIGWWRDQDPLRLYHGTNIINVPFIIEDGINRKDPSTGMISMTPDPFTARGYAAMGSGGGEALFRKAGMKVRSLPMEERAVFAFDVPMSWVLQNYDKELRGNLNQMRDKMMNKHLYHAFNGTDLEYYSTSEIRFRKEIPPSFMVGWMVKV